MTSTVNEEPGMGQVAKAYAEANDPSGQVEREALAALDRETAARNLGAPSKERKDEDEVNNVMARWKDIADDAEIEPYRPTLMPDATTWAHIMRMAHDVELAEILPVALRRKPADIALTLLAGRDIGVAPTVALNKIHVIKGRPTLAAELMRALIVDRGHYFRVLPQTDPCSATVRYRRSDWPEGEVAECTWTLEMAKRAKLINSYDESGRVTGFPSGKDVWAQFTRDMLVARATSQAGRYDFGDVLSGISYTPEEMGAQVDQEGAPIFVESTATIERPERSSEDERASLRALIESQPTQARTAVIEAWAESRFGRLALEGEPKYDIEKLLLKADVKEAAAFIVETATKHREEPKVPKTGAPPEKPPGRAQVKDTADPTAPVEMTVNETTVANMSKSKQMQMLVDFGIEQIPTSPSAIALACVDMLNRRVICGECGKLTADSPRTANEDACECDEGAR